MSFFVLFLYTTFNFKLLESATTAFGNKKLIITESDPPFFCPKPDIVAINNDNVPNNFMSIKI